MCDWFPRGIVRPQIVWAHDIRELVGEQWKEAESERITWRALKENYTQQAVDM